FQQLLIDDAHQRGMLCFCVEAFTRALFRPRGNGDKYIQAALSGKHPQGERRPERRLLEHATLRYSAFEPDEDAEVCSNRFLELESRAWKARDGTALGSHEADRIFFGTFCREAARRGRLQMLGLFLDHRPIALKCTLRAGEGAIAFKIVFDEESD